MIAFDKNGNKAEKSYKLVIKEKSQETASTSQAQQPVASQSGTQSQAPSQSNQSSNGSNASSGSQPAPSQPKTVCPNGNEPQDPNLPCNAWYSGGFDQCYKDSSGNVVTFPSSRTAYDWADAQMMNPDPSQNFQRIYGYSNFVTTPIGKNDNTHYYCVSFE